MTEQADVPWYTVHDNLVILTRYMANQPYFDMGDIASAMEKPWKFEDEFKEAKSELELEQ